MRIVREVYIKILFWWCVIIVVIYGNRHVALDGTENKVDDNWVGSAVAQISGCVENHEWI